MDSPTLQPELVQIVLVLRGVYMKYRIMFHGKKIGAIGVSSFQVVDVEAESIEAARRKAYDTHEHIGGGLEGIQVKTLS